MLKSVCYFSPNSRHIIQTLRDFLMVIYREKTVYSIFFLSFFFFCHFIVFTGFSQQECESESESCLVVSDSLQPWALGILQARTLEWAAFPFSRGSSQPRDQTQVSCIAGFFTSWAMREAHSMDTEVVFHLLLQCTMFCQNCPLWPIHLDSLS